MSCMNVYPPAAATHLLCNYKLLSCIISVLCLYINVFRDTRNALEAIYIGAIDGLRICGYIIANITVIISLLAFLNGVLGWFGRLADIPHLSFQVSDRSGGSSNSTVQSGNTCCV